ncbi:unnamed protein product [Amoebophrya sp. A25]|nr:unnamed protein product [Amoebophrya sp. A25]|eukprot:GSA25T00018083001.1
MKTTSPEGPQHQQNVGHDTAGATAAAGHRATRRGSFSYGPGAVHRSNRSTSLSDDRVDELVGEFFRKHPSFGPMWYPFYTKRSKCFGQQGKSFLPSRMPAHMFQYSADPTALQRQAEVHSTVATLLAGFAFAATANEGGIITSAGAGTTTSASSAGNNYLWVDKALFCLLCSATILFLAQVLHFMYVDMGLGMRAGRKYYMAFSARVGNSCVTFHLGTFLLAACMPLWTYRKFGNPSKVGNGGGGGSGASSSTYDHPFQEPAFTATFVLAAFWVYYDLFVLLPVHDKLNMLLTHADMGIDVESSAKLPSFWGLHSWMPDAWDSLYQQELMAMKEARSEAMESKEAAAAAQRIEEEGFHLYAG